MYETLDGSPDVIERVHAFSRTLPKMTDDELFNTFQIIRDKLMPTAPENPDRFEELFWEAVNIEAEIAGRFPGRSAAAYQAWRAEHDDRPPAAPRP